MGPVGRLVRAALALAVTAAAAVVVNADDVPLLPQNSPGSDCVPAGPDFPPPAHLSMSPLLVSATAEFEALLANASLGLKSNNTAWGVALFSAKENKTLYEYYFTPSMGVGVETVDRDSMFRIGSVSKVFTVWTFLVEAGEVPLNEPVTKYVPELLKAASASKRDGDGIIYDDLDAVQWEDITLGQLASHSAGIARDATLFDFSTMFTPEQLVGYGFPTTDRCHFPVCGANMTQPACTREQFFYYLFQQHPIFPSGHSPAYSNIAYQILEYALEFITGQDLNTAMTAIFARLGMAHSSYKDTPASGGVIPGPDGQAIWDWDLGVDNPSGSIYMSTGDMVTAAQAMLQSALLPPAATRRWFKPVVQTGYAGAAVGAPWEIEYVEAANNRMVQYFTKQGDVNAYHTALVLSPEHEVGWVVLVAGTLDSPASSVRTQLMDALRTVFMPAIEGQAEAEAADNFAGTYVDGATNSTAIITVAENGHPGLGAQALVSRGVPFIGPGVAADHPAVSSMGIGNHTRLYPTNLRTVRRTADGAGAYDSRLGFRAVFQPMVEPGTLQDPCLYMWATLGGYREGQQGIDDWVFERGEDGVATALVLPMLKLRLGRQT
ncbi:Beta-lactamase/transpeptidase-like protein [Pleurostoma richardsiae]|uniref:Beta-lactamase/transpeptidase-like protein n=1 Tax=Pleurostoma richardsiae TaxID=41990 RepID=A0AA38RAS3_9PEZI|nr:Beta-lactamase/transpeptidase-like protein [Pleurostoma richardsiae]